MSGFSKPELTERISAGFSATVELHPGFFRAGTISTCNPPVFSGCL
jgi:hypothetical protein